MQRKQNKENRPGSSIANWIIVLAKSLKVVRKDLPELWNVLMLGLVALVIGVTAAVWSLVLDVSAYVAIPVIVCLFAILIGARHPGARKTIESVVKFLNSLF